MIRSRAIRAAALTAVCAAIYANSLHGALVLDDVSTIVGNTTLRTPLHLRDVFSPPTDTTVAGRPIANATFALDVALFGPNAVAFHATNVVIHLLAAILLMLLVESTLLLPRFGSRYERSAGWLSMGIAALWLAHPMQTQSVTYVSQRVESLMGMFFLLTLYASARARQNRRWTALAAVACALGMGCKEVMAIAPIVVLLYDRAFLFPGFREAVRERAPLYLLLGSTWVVAGVLMATHPRSLSTGLSFAGFSSWDYLRIQFIAVPYYLILALRPTHLVFDYGEGGSPGVPVPHHVWDWLPPAVMLVVLAGTAVAAWRRRPGAGFLGVSFFLVLAPSSSVVPVLTEGMAEHRMYLPLAALLTLLAMGVYELIEDLRARVPARLWPAFYGAAVVSTMMWFSRLTIERNRDYETSLKLWQDTAQKWPANTRALGSYAMALEGVGEIDRAQKVFELVLFSQPTDFIAHYHLGRYLDRRGDCEDAIDHFAIALGHVDNDGLIEFRMARCLTSVGRLSDALAMYQRALIKHPGDGEFETHLALLLWQLGRIDEAIAEHRLAIAHWPEWGEGHALFARTLRHAGHVEEAHREMEHALKLEPDSAPVHAEAGRLAIQDGRWSDARRELEAAAATPDLHVYETLAWLLFERDPRSGVTWAARAAGLSQGTARWCDLGIEAIALRAAGQGSAARAAAADALRLEGRRPAPGDEPLRAAVVDVASGQQPATVPGVALDPS